jgi:hypothetical protein
MVEMDRVFPSIHQALTLSMLAMAVYVIAVLPFRLRLFLSPRLLYLAHRAFVPDNRLPYRSTILLTAAISGLWAAAAPPLSPLPPVPIPLRSLPLMGVLVLLVSLWATYPYLMQVSPMYPIFVQDKR